MDNDGKALENLIRQIEAFLLPAGFTVQGNSRIYNDDGIQIAEFDVEIRSRLGSTDVAWLIECRDRPGDGPAPGSWIEQLVGRRSRFGFDKVTAVSTTGFAAGAAEYAQRAGIEIRNVEEITTADVASWLRSDSVDVFHRNIYSDGVHLLVSENESPVRIAALAAAMRNKTGMDDLLRSTETGERISSSAAFREAVESIPDIFDDVEPNGSRKRVQLHMSYPNDASHYVVNTDAGDIRVMAIVFDGELWITETEVPITAFREYRRITADKPISQTASVTFDVSEATLSLELHKLAESGEIRVVFKAS